MLTANSIVVIDTIMFLLVFSFFITQMIMANLAILIIRYQHMNSQYIIYINMV